MGTRTGERTTQKPKDVQEADLPLPERTGPRPAGLHLLTALSTWTASRAALPLWRHGSPPLKPDQRESAKALVDALAAANPEALDLAVGAEVDRRFRRLWEGIQLYQAHPYRRSVTAPPVLWQEGTTRLLDYGAFCDGKDPLPLLVVPSLINRAYILDLDEKRSFLRWLAAKGYRPLLVDWDAPGVDEKGFTLTDYIAGRLETALDAAVRETGRKPILMGYCMGGLLALGLAIRRQEDLSGLVLLATPWDFHAENPDHARMAASMLVPLAPMLDVLGELPVDLIQTLFATLDPQLVVRKFINFSRLSPRDPKGEAFVALEDWLNDGVPLVAPVARECLGGWYGENTTAAGRWRLAGHPVVPEEVSLPSLCLIPAGDRIVPPASASALAEGLPQCEVQMPAWGHIGMVASRRAERGAWRPLLSWLEGQTT